MMKHCCLVMIVFLLSCHASVAFASDEVELPPFRPATVTVEDDPVSIQFRRFDLGASLGEIDRDTLPASATKTVTTAWQVLSDGDLDTFLDSALDREQAERFAQAIEKEPKEERTAWFEKILGRKVVGELKVEDTTMVVAVLKEDGESDPTVYFTTPVNGQELMVAVPYYLLKEVKGLRTAVSIANQLRTGELSLKQLDG